MKSVMLRVRVTDGDMVLYRAAASKAGEDLSAWVRGVLGAAVLDGRSPPKPAAGHKAIASDIGAIVNETLASYKESTVQDLLKQPILIGPPVEVEFRVNVEEARDRSTQMYAEMVERAEADQYPTPAMRDPDEEEPPILPEPSVRVFDDSVPAGESAIDEKVSAALVELYPAMVEDAKAILTPEPLEVAPIEPAVPQPALAYADGKFRPAADCDSPSRCSRLQAPTCEPCKRANALANAVVPSTAYEPPKPWKNGKRAPGCITKTCERIAAPACDPCRRFNAEVEF